MMQVKYKFFWNSDSYFSNWYKCKFTVNGITFNCAEQYMMYQKAILFDDKHIARRILNEVSPAEQKRLGREIKKFDHFIWNNVKKDIVKKGLYQKFAQNPKLKDYLLKHKGYIMVEASPYDRIWGIGYQENNALDNINNWGENLLGKILTELSQEI